MPLRSRSAQAPASRSHARRPEPLPMDPLFAWLLSRKGGAIRIASACLTESRSLFSQSNDYLLNKLHAFPTSYPGPHKEFVVFADSLHRFGLGAKKTSPDGRAAWALTTAIRVLSIRRSSTRGVLPRTSSLALLLQRSPLSFLRNTTSGALTLTIRYLWPEPHPPFDTEASMAGPHSSSLWKSCQVPHLNKLQ